MTTDVISFQTASIETLEIEIHEWIKDECRNKGFRIISTNYSCVCKSPGCNSNYSALIFYEYDREGMN